MFRTISLIIVMTVFSSSLFAFDFGLHYDCGQFEAQIIGQVKVEHELRNGCLVKLTDTLMYNQHVFCPLMIEEALSTEIELTFDQCLPLRSTGSGEISGVLVQMRGDDVITLE